MTFTVRLTRVEVHIILVKRDVLLQGMTKRRRLLGGVVGFTLGWNELRDRHVCNTPKSVNVNVYTLMSGESGSMQRTCV